MQLVHYEALYQFSSIVAWNRTLFFQHVKYVGYPKYLKISRPRCNAPPALPVNTALRVTTMVSYSAEWCHGGYVCIRGKRVRSLREEREVTMCRLVWRFLRTELSKRASSSVYAASLGLSSGPWSRISVHRQHFSTSLRQHTTGFGVWHAYAVILAMFLIPRNRLWNRIRVHRNRVSNRFNITRGLPLVVVPLRLFRIA